MTRLMRQDVIAINRQFLVMTREAADSPTGEIITGLSKRTMTSIAKLSLEQIEEIAVWFRPILFRSVAGLYSRRKV